MNFVTPLFWLGAFAATVPILLHLIRRESAQKVEFPTLMFLRRISKRIIRYQKLRHLLLLLMRVLALLLLALAFMRPYRDRPRVAAASGEPATAHVILLDNSMSMAHEDRWARARDAVAAIVRGARTGDKVALLEFSDRTSVLTLPATDFAAVLGQLERDPQLTDRATRYGQALRIAEKSALDAGTGKRVIHLISDFQKSGWAADESDFRLGPGVELQCTDVGSDSFSNLAIGDVQVLENDEDAAGGLKIRFSVFNFGAEDRNAVRVSLSVDDRILSEKRVDTPKGEVRGLEFSTPTLIAGMHRVALELEDGRLTRDNRFTMTLQARTKIPVISVESPGRGMAGRPPSFFLANALNISALSPYRLSAVTVPEFESMGAITGGLLIWNNAPAGGAAVQKKLQEYVKGGGGLIVVLPDGARAPEFNRLFASWLPVRIEAEGNAGRQPARSSEGYALLTDLRIDHPIFQPFSAPHAGTFTGARFFSHARLAVSPQGQILARFDSGDPALVAADIDKGRVLVFASSADDATNDLPVKAVYAPFWHQMLRHLENFRHEKPWMDVGDTIAPRKLLVEAAVRQGKGNLDLNQAIVVMDSRKERVSLAPGSDAVAVELAGYYEVRTASLNTSVAVNPVLRESDLAHGNPEEMAAGWMSTEAAAPAVVSPDERPTAEEQEKRERLWRYLLLGVLILLIFEGLLSNHFILRTG